MATNPYSGYSDLISNYLDTRPQVIAAYSTINDPVTNVSNAEINRSANRAAQRKDIEWANKQRMLDPNYWAQAFGGGGTNSLGSLVSPQNISQSDAYKWNFEQGREAVNRTAAAKGMLGSGNRLAELTKFGQGLASQEYGNEFNRQLALKQLEADNRRMNMQSAMQGMQSMLKMAPQIGGW